MKLNKILSICIILLFVVGCKKVDEKDRKYYSGGSSEVTKQTPALPSSIIAKYTHPSPISDIYIVCVEGQKVGISDTGSLVKLDFVGGVGIQNCN